MNKVRCSSLGGDEGGRISGSVVWEWTAGSEERGNVMGSWEH